MLDVLCGGRSAPTMVAMHPASTPLTLMTAITSWRLDVSSAVLIVAVSGCYVWCCRVGGRRIDAGAACCFAIGIALWALAAMSMVGVYAGVLFWVRALQVLLLLFMAPFFVALGTPFTVLRCAFSPSGQDRFDRVLATRWARVVAHPATTSIAMLATPWLLYLTPWYTAALTHQPVATITDILLLLIGFGYFYARLQADPVPRRYSQMVSMVISIVETLGDGLLGIVLWLGPLIAADYYLGLHRNWGPSMRVDQSIGAGILWLLGDALGVPFLILLMRALTVDEKARAVEVDAELDRVEESEPERAPESTLWWQNDPQLHDRFRR
jgi:cytochrome c oxidase assembly factor CtaG